MAVSKQRMFAWLDEYHSKKPDAPKFTRVHAKHNAPYPGDEPSHSLYAVTGKQDTYVPWSIAEPYLYLGNVNDRVLDKALVVYNKRLKEFYNDR